MHASSMIPNLAIMRGIQQHCVLIYKEVIHHSVNNDSTVYSCLDPSNAFDRVHPGKL